LPLATDSFWQISPLANVQIFGFLIGLPVWAVNVYKKERRRKMKKNFVLLAVLALFMLAFGSCETLSDEAAYNLGYSAGYLGAEISS
jgi:ABC-type Co2+ transport system permease subunit